MSRTSGPETREPSDFRLRLARPPMGASTGPAQVEAGFLQAGAGRLKVGAGDRLGRCGVVVFLLADGGFPGGFKAPGIAPGLGVAGFGRSHVGLGSGGGFEGRRIDGNSDCPADQTASPWLRRKRMPVTRARTSTSREPKVWAAYSRLTGSASGCTASTLTGPARRNRPARRAASPAAGGSARAAKARGRGAAQGKRGARSC